MESIIDSYLIDIQADREIEVIDEWLEFTIASVLVGKLFQFLIKISSPESKRLTNRFRKLMQELDDKHSKQYVVRIVDDKMPNAFTFGGKDVFVTKGLLKILSDRELEAVLLHEVGHVIHMDVLIKQISTISFDGALYFLMTKILAKFNGSIALMYIMLLIYYTAPQILSNLLFAHRSEYRADNYAAQLGYANDLKNALIKLEEFYKKWAKENNVQLQSDTKCKTKFCEWYKKLANIFSTHPENKDRIEKLEPFITKRIKSIQASQMLA